MLTVLLRVPRFPCREITCRWSWLCARVTLPKGLDVTLVEPADHWEAEMEILEGRLDVAVTESAAPGAKARAGVPVLRFSRFLHTDGGVMPRFVNISRPRDMCGRNISYPGSPRPRSSNRAGECVPARFEPAPRRGWFTESSAHALAYHPRQWSADGGTCDLASYGKRNGGFYTAALARRRPTSPRSSSTTSRSSRRRRSGSSRASSRSRIGACPTSASSVRPTAAGRRDC